MPALKMAGGGRLAAAVAMLGLAGAALGEINLELRAAPEPCLGRELRIELYAVSDSGEDQSIAAMDVILAWDPAVLRLLGVDTTGPYPYAWLFSGFSNDGGLDGLNNTWEDGNAKYTALAQLGGAPAYATPEGLLVTALRFRKLRVGSPTAVTMPETFGQYTRTVVYDGFVPGLDVTGTLTGATVLPSARGDVNCDGVVDFGDIDPLVVALLGQAVFEQAYPGCNWYNADCNCDGTVDFYDIDPWIVLLSS